MFEIEWWIVGLWWPYGFFCWVSSASCQAGRWGRPCSEAALQTHGAQVPVYFLNGKFDYRHMIDWTAGDIDCVHTVGPPMPMPEKVNYNYYYLWCVRWLPCDFSNKQTNIMFHIYYQHNKQTVVCCPQFYFRLSHVYVGILFVKTKSDTSNISPPKQT